jgi:hypothetical protein
MKMTETSRISSNSGIANALVILVVTLACAGLVTSYILAGPALAAKEKIKTIEDEKKQIDKEKAGIQELIPPLAPFITDITRYGSEVDPEDVRSILEKKIKEYKLASRVDRLEEIGGEDLTLEVIINILGRRITAVELGEKLAEYGKNSSEQRGRKFSAAVGDITKIKDDEIADIRKQSNDLTATEAKEDTMYSSRVNELNSRKNVLEGQKKQKEDKFREQKVDIDYRINRIKQEIEFLATREIIKRDIVEVQGEIIRPAVKEGYAFITLGANDNMKLGLKFRVFRKDKNGTRKWKGQVEVKKVFNGYSLVSITNTANPSDPIVEGDYINNIFYSRNRTKYVVLIGEIEQPDFRYNRAEIERRLTELGAKVEPNVSLKTDFAIIGKNYEGQESYNTIALLNITYVDGEEARQNIEYCLGD